MFGLESRKPLIPKEIAPTTHKRYTMSYVPKLGFGLHGDKNDVNNDEIDISTPLKVRPSCVLIKAEYDIQDHPEFIEVQIHLEREVL